MGVAKVIVERLSFEEGAPPYHSYHAAQHSVRYLLVRAHLRGKRVLDVACGQGFGSYLMADWGAAQVVGVDIAPDAIKSARSIFRHKNVRYVLGDACNLDQVLAKERPFDLIVCFETIEHVSDPARLLKHLVNFRAPDGTVVISCPNDNVGQVCNPYHSRPYTFEEFRELTTLELGTATQWLLGVPVCGQMNYSLGDPAAEDPGSEPINITRLQDLSNTFVAPAQENTSPNCADCTYYVGIWGGALTPNAVIAPQSHSSFLQPWRTIDYLQSKLAEIEAAKQAIETHLNERDHQITELEQILVSTDFHHEAYQLMRRRLIHHAEERNHTIEQLTEARRELSHTEAARKRLESVLRAMNLEWRSERPKRAIALWKRLWRELHLAGKLNQLMHYIRFDAVEGRESANKDRRLVQVSGLFDAAYYRARYPDVAEAGVDPLDHYLQVGGLEGRVPGPEFDAAWYLAQYPDIAASKLNPLVHYIRFGAAEGREVAPTVKRSAALPIAVPDETG